MAGHLLRHAEHGWPVIGKLYVAQKPLGPDKRRADQT